MGATRWVRVACIGVVVIGITVIGVPLVQQSIEDVDWINEEIIDSSEGSDLQNATCACLAPTFGLLLVVMIVIGIVGVTLEALRRWKGSEGDDP